ncbi:hypothetical protein APY94_03760 [Thermococcus celericrescens]|uniref:Type I restriction modification DNA specificity domain-containing protein n=1 Tax=Thermococcus celericrescens TaxID=227598 RepID=A0A117ITY6_9EURY|nr:restriction endonuclease subunit S [Thermococcus celericrescens]KUH34000.1 hypothetical protein APY94_03760 [Thermococcus celericrescens]
MSELPEGWVKALVKDLFHVETGTTPPTGVREYWEKGTVNWYTPVDLSKIAETIYLPESERKITIRAVKEAGLRVIPRDSIIVSTRAPVGYVGLTLVESTFNQGCKGLVPKESDVATEFFAYYLKWIRPQLEKYSGGSTFQELKKEALENLTILKPPLPEQRKIAEILLKVDSLIEKTERIIEKYERIKRGLSQDLLTRGIDENGHIRSEETHEFKDSPVGRIPKEWNVGYVSDFSDINPKTPIDPNQVYPFIEMDAVPIRGKMYKYLSYRKGSEAGSKFKGGDILLARITPSAENGKALLVPEDIEIGIGSTEFIVFRAKEGVDKEFLFYLLTSDYVHNRAVTLMEGTSGRQRIPTYVFDEIIQVAMPPLPEQRRIAQVLSQVDNILDKERRELEKLKRLKRGLMNDLLSGKVRATPLLEGEVT